MNCSICAREPTQRILVVNGAPTKVTTAVVTCWRCRAQIVFCADCLAQKADEKIYSWLAGSHRESCATKEEGQDKMGMKAISITFNELTVEQASALVSLAGSLGSASGAPVAKAAPAQADDEEEDAPPPPRKGPPPPKVDPSKVTVAKPVPKAAPAPKKAPEPEPADDDEDEEEAPPPKKTAATATKKPAPPPDDEDEDDADEDAGEELPEELLGAKKLRDVLEYLMDKQSITAVDKLKAECARLKEAVPVLSRIANLDERIDRTLEVMDMGETG